MRDEQVQTAERLLRYVVENGFVYMNDRLEMGIEVHGLEVILNVLLQAHPDLLMHGSRTRITNGVLQPGNEKRPVFATDDPRIAILKAVFLNNAKNLEYDQRRGVDRFWLRIENAQADTVGEKGYVYIVRRSGFANTAGKSEWSCAADVPVIGSIEVVRADFRHPVEEIVN